VNLLKIFFDCRDNFQLDGAIAMLFLYVRELEPHLASCCINRKAKNKGISYPVKVKAKVRLSLCLT
jgi:hypothetical protein